MHCNFMPCTKTQQDRSYSYSSLQCTLLLPQADQASFQANQSACSWGTCCTWPNARSLKPALHAGNACILYAFYNQACQEPISRARTPSSPLKFGEALSGTAEWHRRPARSIGAMAPSRALLVATAAVLCLAASCNAGARPHPCAPGLRTLQSALTTAEKRLHC